MRRRAEGDTGAGRHVGRLIGPAVGRPETEAVGPGRPWRGHRRWRRVWPCHGESQGSGGGSGPATGREVAALARGRGQRRRRAQAAREGKNSGRHAAAEPAAEPWPRPEEEEGPRQEEAAGEAREDGRPGGSRSPGTLLQQLQKLQALVAGKVSRPYKMASTQTGTCLMVLVLCFVLVLGSMMPCLPEFSATSQTVKTAPTPDIYTTSKIQSRSLLFYDEHGGSLEEGYSSFISVEHPENWEADKGPSEEQPPQEHVLRPLAVAHGTAKYLNKPRLEGPEQNSTSSALTHPKERFHERERSPSDTAEYL